PALETVGGPDPAAVVIGLDRARSLRQANPRQLRARIDVDVGLDVPRRIQRADADEAQDVPGAAVIAPQRNLALRTAPDLLPASALGWSHDRLGRAFESLDLAAFDQ